ncbi:MAG: CotH kinase family protein, partial [Oscillospiraceae bacterium]|nr:CotH kinase family protein [Oscillospiraceae bacterium]
FRLRCGDREMALAEETLAPGAYRLILCGEGSALRLPKSGGELMLLDAQGRCTDRLRYPAMEADISACRTDSGDAELTTWASPGYVNSEEGYSAFQASLTAPDGLRINEVMVYNDRYIPQNGQYFDWVEIINPTDQIIQASDYYLSDKGKERLLYQLPSRRMRPGERMLILCTEESEGVTGYRAPFGLSSGGETLYLSRSDEMLQDYVNLHDIPLGCSYGRVDGLGGFCYMSEPTPGKANKQGYRLIAAQPTLLGEDGVFQDVESVTVTLQGEGTIHYTLDGSTPTESSPVYEGPFPVRETTAVRAVCLVPGRLSSPVLNLSYILNEEHTLPIVSLVADKADLFGRTGLYDHPNEDWERPATVAYYGSDGSFRLDCGVKLHGATSKITQAKKSLKLNFRDRYAGELSYDLFQNGVTLFSSIVLRAAQESSQSTYIHDTLMHELAEECFPELPAQDHKYAVLYINGQYWGIYNIREAHSEAHYARHYGYAIDSVSHWKKIWGHHTQAEEVCNFILNNDMRIPENYAFACQHINLDSVIGWSILQAYCSNF